MFEATEVKVSNAYRACVVVPCYNPGVALREVLSSLSSCSLDLIVVDDGSNAETKSILDDAHLKNLVSLATNQGKGKALRAGFLKARELGFTHVLTFDADGQHLASSIEDLISASRQNPTAIVVGARRMDREINPHVPNSSLFGRSFSNFWVWTECSAWGRDTQSGLRVYPIRSAILSQQISSHYDFEIEVVVRHVWTGGKIVDVDVDVYYPPRNERISHFKGVADNARLSWLHTRLVSLGLIWRLFPNLIVKTLGDGDVRPEVRGASSMPLFLRFFGYTLCSMIVPIVVSVIFMQRHVERHALALFYMRRFNQSYFKSLRMAWTNFFQFALMLLDRTARQMKMSAPPIRKVQEFPQHFLKEPGVLLCSHFGDWLSGAADLGFNTGFKVAAVMDKSVNPKFQAVLDQLSKDSFRILDASSDTIELMLNIRQLAKDGWYIGFMADRVGEGSPTAQLQFLGGAATFAVGGIRIAKLLKLPVYALFTRRIGFLRPQYLLEVVDLGSTEHEALEIAQRYAVELEARVRAHPNNWFNFYDFWRDEDIRRERIPQQSGQSEVRV
jgi:predicted LPLAT superfamily acyltransferase